MGHLGICWRWVQALWVVHHYPVRGAAVQGRRAEIGRTQKESGGAGGGLTPVH